MSYRVGGYLYGAKDADAIPFSRAMDKFKDLSKSVPGVWFDGTVPDVGMTKFAGSSLVSLEEFTPISNQYEYSSCVSNAWADALEILIGIDRKARGSFEPVPQLSRMFLYWNARSRDGLHGMDGGSHIHSAARQLQEIGICPESIWPYTYENLKRTPSLEAFNMASDNTVSGLYEIQGDRGDAVEVCINCGHPVVLGIAVGQNFMESNGVDVLGPPRDEKGRHAVIITGVRTWPGGKRTFRLRNSWGDGWGHKGHCEISEEYLNDSRTNDLWVATRMDDLCILQRAVRARTFFSGARS